MPWPRTSTRFLQLPFQCLVFHLLMKKGDAAKMSFATSPKKFMSERGDSNARPLRPERSALPTALLSDCTSKVSDFW